VVGRDIINNVFAHNLPSDWSGCGVPPTVLALPRRGLFCTSFSLVIHATSILLVAG
jgi:hypothetical protein